MTFTVAVCLVFLAVTPPILAKPSQVSQKRKEYLPSAGEAYSLSKSGKEVKDIWSNCTKDDDMCVIHSVTITPNPPVKGKLVIIDAKFTLKETISGGTFTGTVKYDFIPITRTLQLCDVVIGAGLSCPIPQSTNNIKVNMTLPSEIPSGHYTGQVIGVDQNGKQIGCVNLDFEI